LAITIAVSFRKKLKVWGTALMAVGVGAGLVLANFTHGRQISAEGGADRLELWSEGLELLKHSKFLGIGYHNFVDEVGLTAHNSFVLVASESGIIGLILFVATIVISYTQLARIRKFVTGRLAAPAILREAKAYELALTGYLGTSWFLSRAYHPMPFLLFGLIAAFTSECTSDEPKAELLPPAGIWVRNSVILAIAILLLVYVMVHLRPS
jgi:O-antigen ligase